METIQVRLTKKLREKLDELVSEGFYPNRSEVIREAVRRLILEQALEELSEELEEGIDEIKKNGRKKELLNCLEETRNYCY